LLLLLLLVVVGWLVQMMIMGMMGFRLGHGGGAAGDYNRWETAGCGG
jgi:hypothetical protein